MAVHCNVCGCGIDNAGENDGGFDCDPKTFDGWNKAGGRTVIHDTCEGCGEILRKAISVAASKIASKYTDRIKKLAQEIEFYRRVEEANKKDKEEFEREWMARRKVTKV